MPDTSSIDAIYTCEARGRECHAVSNAQLVAGRGIVGDRYFIRQDSFSFRENDTPEKELTLIEQEAIDDFNRITGLEYSSGLFRRNIVTRGVSLNALVGKEFMVGNVRVKGVELCEPCSALSKLLGRQVMDHMVHKAGLRAQILSDGTIHVGDLVTACAPQE